MKMRFVDLSVRNNFVTVDRKSSGVEGFSRSQASEFNREWNF